MRPLGKSSLVLLVALCLFFAAATAASAAPVVNSVTFASSAFGDGSGSTGRIVNQAAILSAYFASGTPTGPVSVNVTQAASMPKLVTSKVYYSVSTNVCNNGTITINGHQFVCGVWQILSDVIQAINNAGIGILATFNGYHVVLTSTSGLGSFTYAETADILNGGAGNNSTGYGCAARAIVTYSDGSTENYSTGSGYQLIGDIRHGIINLSVAGGSAVTNLGHCIDVVSHGSVASSSYPTSVIVDRSNVASASFARGTPLGCIGINVTSAGTKARYTTSRIFATPHTIVGSEGAVTVNGHVLNVTNADTVEDLIYMINNANVGVTASFAYEHVVLSDDSGYGSNYSFTYAETTNILNGGAGNNSTRVGSDAVATITYSNGFTECYSSGKGLQLIGNTRGGVINLTEAGDMIAVHAGAICITPSNLIGCRDAVTVTLDVSDIYPITSITSPVTGPLTNNSGGIWTGTFCAASTPGTYDVTFIITDSAGVSTVTAAYTTLPVFGANIRSIYHSIMDSPPYNSPPSKYIYTVCGNVTDVESDGFYISDGSGCQLKVLGGGTCNVGDHVIVRGHLDMGAQPHVIVAHGVTNVH